MRKTGVSLPAIERAVNGHASLATAVKLHFATKGAVDITSMTRDRTSVKLKKAMSGAAVSS